MRVSDSVLNLMVGVCMLCAVVVAGDAILRRFEPKSGASRGAVAVTEVKDWRNYAEVGQRIGPPTARVTLVEFADFECPVCRKFATGALRVARARYPADLQVMFRHFPLSYHKQAYPAARAAECAAEQQAFESFHDLLYAEQDSLGKKPYRAFAREAGARDLKAFDLCNARSDSLPNIGRDVAAGTRLKIRGTPALIINGKMYGGALDSAALLTAISEALGKANN